MSRCIICKKTDRPKLFFFPSDQTRQKKWIEIVEAETDVEIVVNESSVICSDHFISKVLINGSTINDSDPIPPSKVIKAYPTAYQVFQNCCAYCKVENDGNLLKFFRFPKGRNKWQWIKMIRTVTSNFLPTSTSSVCMNHIHPDNMLGTDRNFILDDSLLLPLTARQKVITAISLKKHLSLSSNVKKVRASAVTEEFQNNSCAYCNKQRSGNKPHFTFPQNEKIKCQWLQTIRKKKPSFQPTATSSVCINHFALSDIVGATEKYLSLDAKLLDDDSDFLNVESSSENKFSTNQQKRKREEGATDGASSKSKQNHHAKLLAENMNEFEYLRDDSDSEGTPKPTIVVTNRPMYTIITQKSLQKQKYKQATTVSSSSTVRKIANSYYPSRKCFLGDFKKDEMSDKQMATQFHEIAMREIKKLQKNLVDAENEGKELIRKRDEQQNYHCEFCDE